MIFDSLAHFSNYLSIHSLFKDILDYITDTDLSAVEKGKHFVGNNGVFAIADSYLTKDESSGFIECHRKYIDIQIVVQGIEMIGICPVSMCKTQPYDQEKDLQKLEGELSYLKLPSGFFAVFYPHDGHMPGLKYDKPEMVKKIVMKVPV